MVCFLGHCTDMRKCLHRRVQSALRYMRVRPLCLLRENLLISKLHPSVNAFDSGNMRMFLGATGQKVGDILGLLILELESFNTYSTSAVTDSCDLLHRS
jgi:hypothetical protein